jgi:hypothetical protein
MSLACERLKVASSVCSSPSEVMHHNLGWLVTSVEWHAWWLIGRVGVVRVWRLILLHIDIAID